MFNKLVHTKTHYYLAIAIALCLPLVRLTPVFIALLLLNWLLEGDFKNKFQIVFKNRLALLFIAFFLIHVVGLAYTENMDSGLFDLQVKFSLLIFPIIFVSRPFNREQIKNMFWAFVIGSIVCSFILLTRAVYTYFIFDENNFFYLQLSFFTHPSYIAMYFNLVIAWLMLGVFKKEQDSKRLPIVLSVCCIVFFSFMIVLLSSKMGLIVLLGLYLGFTIYFIISRKKYLLGFVGLLVIISSVFLLARFVPEITDRFKTVISAVTSTSNNQAESESSAVRMLIWSAANQVISENLLLGAGTGDGKDKLLEEYDKRGMTVASEHQLNAHNAYYQVFVSLGLIGFVLLLLSLLLPLYTGFASSNAIYILFLLIIILNFLPESMFETQAGVIFFAFFNSLLCFNSSYISKHSKN